jgi:hypothetical protein
MQGAVEAKREGTDCCRVAQEFPELGIGECSKAIPAGFNKFCPYHSKQASRLWKRRERRPGGAYHREWVDRDRNKSAAYSRAWRRRRRSQRSSKGRS